MLGWVLGSESVIEQVLVVSPVPTVLAPEVESKYSEGAGEPACQELEHAPRGSKRENRSEFLGFFK